MTMICSNKRQTQNGALLLRVETDPFQSTKQVSESIGHRTESALAGSQTSGKPNIERANIILKICQNSSVILIGFGCWRRHCHRHCRRQSSRIPLSKTLFIGFRRFRLSKRTEKSLVICDLCRPFVGFNARVRGQRGID